MKTRGATIAPCPKAAAYLIGLLGVEASEAVEDLPRGDERALAKVAGVIARALEGVSIGIEKKKFRNWLSY